MHCAAAAVLLLLVSPLFAAPTSSSHLVIPSHPPIESTPAHTSLSHSFSSRRHHSVDPSHIASRPTPQSIDIPSPSPYELDPKVLQVEQGQKKLAIALGVIAGFISFSFLGCIIRCTFRYKAPPKRDRIAEVLQRHNLQRELEELEHHPHALRRPSLREPAPPYSPRPPSYTESVIGTARPEETSERRNPLLH